MANSIGGRVYYAVAAPATNNATGFEALSWLPVDSLVQGPQFGITHSAIDIPDLLTGFTKAVKGAAAGNSTELQFHTANGTTGHAGVKTQAEDEDGISSLKYVQDGTGAAGAPATGDPVIYAQGFLHSYLDNQPTTSSYEGFSVTFRQNASAVVATEPA